MSMFYELMMKKKGMPSRYQEVEYIESTGTQYIKTGYIPNINTEFIVDCSFDNIYVGRFGRLISGSGTGARFYFGVAGGSFVGANSGSYNHSIMTANTNEHLFNLNKNGLYIDGELKYSNSGDATENPADLYIFALHDLDNGTGTDKVNYLAQCKIRYCTIKENGVVKRNYIPVYDTETQKYGMWESVQGKFYGNDGTGDFKGSIVGYTVVGSPTITDGVASGFSASNYLALQQPFTLSPTTKAEFVFRVSNTTFDGSSSFLGMIGSYSINFRFNTAKKLALFLGNGSSWVVSGLEGTTVFQENNFYYAKLVFDNGVITIYSSTDGKIWTQEATTTVSFTYTYNLLIGRANNDASYQKGSIDLNETYIKVNNKLWFNGQQA